MDTLTSDLINKIRYLLEWMPICSEGSSEHSRRVAVETAIQAIQKFETEKFRNLLENWMEERASSTYIEQQWERFYLPLRPWSSG